MLIYSGRSVGIAGVYVILQGKPSTVNVAVVLAVKL